MKELTKNEMMKLDGGKSIRVPNIPPIIITLPFPFTTILKK